MSLTLAPSFKPKLPKLSSGPEQHAHYLQEAVEVGIFAYGQASLAEGGSNPREVAAPESGDEPFQSGDE
jgi:hypothetical protein